jgi:hypothetical protein
MTFSPLEIFGLVSAMYLITTSLQQVLFKYGYARGKEEALRDAKLAAKEAAR